MGVVESMRREHPRQLRELPVRQDVRQAAPTGDIALVVDSETEARAENTEHPRLVFRRPTRFPVEAVVLMLAAFATDQSVCRLLSERLPEDEKIKLGTLNSVEAHII